MGIAHERCQVRDAHWAHDWQRFDFDAYRVIELRCPGQVEPHPTHPAIPDTFLGDFKFWTGAPEPSWLWNHLGPWFVSNERLSRLKTFKPVLAGQEWVLDSGGFSHLRTHGRWMLPAREYAAQVRRYADEIGGLTWAATQDWMCEDFVINGGTFGGMTFVGTGLTKREHQHRSVGSYLDLMAIDSTLPWVPIVQGDTLADYFYCWDLYERAGIDLTQQPIVGLGSVCRRQHTAEITELVRELAALGAPLHGFGVKTLGLNEYGRLLASADSQWWSKAARSQHIRLDGCEHANCNYCPRWARQAAVRLESRLDLI